MNKMTKNKLIAAIAVLVFVISLIFPSTRIFLRGWVIGEILLFQKVLMHFQGGFPHLGTLHVILLYGFSLYGFIAFTIRLSKLDLIKIVKSIPSKIQAILFDFRKNWRTYILCLVWCVFWAVLSIEIYLRHEGMYDSYAEMRGGWFYVSPFEESDHYMTFPSKIEQNILKYAHHVFNSSLNNQFGFSDHKWNLQKTSKTRILTIGDSFTEGIGSTSDSSYPAVLRCQLSKDSFEVLNAGRSGSDPVFEYRLLKDHLLQFQPDIIIMNMNNSDMNDLIDRTGFERFHSDGTLQYRDAPWWEWFYGRLYIVRYITHKLLHFNYQFLQPSQVPFFEKKAKKDWQCAIDSVASVCQDNQMRLILSFNPSQNDLLNDTFDIQNIVDNCMHKNYQIVNIFDSLQNRHFDSKHPQEVKYLFVPNDGHFTNKGYALMATSIKKTIENK